MTNESYWVLGQRVTIIQASANYTFVDIIAPPSVPGPPPHLHRDCTELFYQLEGQLLGYEWQILNPSDGIAVPPGSFHTFLNPTNKEVRFITVFSPGGFERFFRDFGVPVDDPNAQSASVEEEIIRRVIATAGHYGMELLNTK